MISTPKLFEIQQQFEHNFIQTNRSKCHTIKNETKN